MSKIQFEFEFTYFMGESLEEENAEYANYKIDINNVNLNQQEVQNALIYIKDYLIQEMGHCSIKNKFIKNEYAVNVTTEQLDATELMDLLNKIHVKFKLLFNSAQVEELTQVGDNDLTYNTKKPKI